MIGGLITIGPRFSTTAPDPFAERREPQGLAFLEWVLPLGLLNVLFLLFVLVQLTVLFGGRQHVLETVDLSYAEYARSGFFQLLAVAFLTFAVIGATVRWARARGPLQTYLLRGLLVLLCSSTLVVLGSALKRLMLYEDVYGLTRLRVSVHAVILLLAVFFVLVIAATLLWRGDWLARTSVAVVGVALLVFSLVNPDAQIARQNVERFERTGVVDAAYLSSLSVDAAGYLDELPEPLGSCIVRGLDGVDLSTNWAELNVARSLARDEVDAARRQVGTGCTMPPGAWESLVE